MYPQVTIQYYVLIKIIEISYLYFIFSTTTILVAE